MKKADAAIFLLQKKDITLGDHKEGRKAYNFLCTFEYILYKNAYYKNPSPYFFSRPVSFPPMSLSIYPPAPHS